MPWPLSRPPNSIGMLNAFLEQRAALARQAAAILFFRARRANHRTDPPLAASPIIRRYAADVGASAGGRSYTSKSQPSPPSLTSVRLRTSAIGTQASPSAVLRRSFISGAGV